MSEKKSWDIQPKRSVPVAAPQAAAPVRRPAARPAPARSAPTPKPVRSPKVRQQRPATKAVATKPRHERVVQGKNREPLRDQRIRARKRARVMLIAFSIVLAAALFGALWLPAFRVQHVDAAGPDALGVQTIAANDLTGYLYYIVPRNSIFFAPTNTIRAHVQAKYPDISAVAISRSSFSSLAITSVPRVASFTWCGQDQNTPAVVATAVTPSDTASSTDDATTQDVPPSEPTTPTCYDVDSQGFIFAETAATTEPADHSVLLYGPLSNASSTPITNTVLHASAIPNALQFVKTLSGMGITIQKLVLHSDEADLYTPQGTRITYVLGKEAQAAQLAKAGLPSLQVSDGSLDYVDLRFADKVYYMKKGFAAPESTATASSTSQ